MPCILKVRIVAGRNLPIMDRASELTDAYVEVKFSDFEVQRTQICRKTLNPVWNEDFRFECSDDSELQNEPLEIRVLDYDAISYNDMIGNVFIDLNPLLTWDSNSTISGWFPIFDTLRGVRGEIHAQIKLQFFGDINPFKDSSAGVQFFSMSCVPPGYHIQSVLGFVEVLENEDDPEYHWSDNFRTPRTSNEARTRCMFRLSGQVRRQLGKKVLEMGGNAVVGFRQHFDFESEERVITARAVGSAVKLLVPEQTAPIWISSAVQKLNAALTNLGNVNASGMVNMNQNYGTSGNVNVEPVDAVAIGGKDTIIPGTPKSSRLTLTIQKSDSAAVSSSAPASASVSTPLRNQVEQSSSTSSPIQDPATSDPSANPTSPIDAAHLVPQPSQQILPQPALSSSFQQVVQSLIPAPFITTMPASTLSQQIITLTKLPAYSIQNIGGLVTATSVKIIDNDDSEVRDAWWTELRDEIKSHAKTLGCNIVFGYTERASISDDLCVLTCQGTAGILNLHMFGQPDLAEVLLQKRGMAAYQNMLSQQVTLQKQWGLHQQQLQQLQTHGSHHDMQLMSGATMASLEAHLNGNIDGEGGSQNADNDGMDRERRERAISNGGGVNVGSVPVDIAKRGPSWTSLSRSYDGNNSGLGNAGDPSSPIRRDSFKDTVLSLPEVFDSRRRHKLRKLTPCQSVHIPYPRRQSPFPMSFSKCCVCRKKHVPEVLLSTIEPPPELETLGHGILLEAHVCRPKKKKEGESNATIVSESIPFAQYDIHRQLTYKLRILGYNAIFGLKLQITVGESLIIAVATGTAMYVKALPPPPPLKVMRNLEVIDEEDRKLLELQYQIMAVSERNRKQIEAALAASDGNGGNNPNVKQKSQESLGGKSVRKDENVDTNGTGSDLKDKEKATEGASEVTSPQQQQPTFPLNDYDDDSSDSSDSESLSDSESDEYEGLPLDQGTAAGVRGHDTTIRRDQRNMVVQIDDTTDEDLLSVLLDPAYEIGFRVMNIETVPKLSTLASSLAEGEELVDGDGNIIRSPVLKSAPLAATSAATNGEGYYHMQMMTVFKQGFINLAHHHPNRQLATLFKQLYEEMQFQLSYFDPCVIAGVDYEIQLPKENEVQIRLTAVALGQMLPVPLSLLDNPLSQQHNQFKLLGSRGSGGKLSLMRRAARLPANMKDGGGLVGGNSGGSNTGGKDSKSQGKGSLTPLTKLSLGDASELWKSLGLTNATTSGITGMGSSSSSSNANNIPSSSGTGAPLRNSLMTAIMDLKSMVVNSSASTPTTVATPIDHNANNQNTPNDSNTSLEEDMVFDMDDENGNKHDLNASQTTGVHGLMGSVSRSASNIALTRKGTLEDGNAPLSPASVMARNSSHRFGKSISGIPFPVYDAHNIEVTPLSYIPNGRIKRYLGRLSLHFVKEASINYESPTGGMGSFVHLFLTEVLSVSRSHTAALGGNGLIAFSVDQSYFEENLKNQGYAFLSVSGDVVEVAYGVVDDEGEELSLESSMGPLGMKSFSAAASNEGVEKDADGNENAEDNDKNGSQGGLSSSGLNASQSSWPGSEGIERERKVAPGHAMLRPWISSVGGSRYF